MLMPSSVLAAGGAVNWEAAAKSAAGAGPASEDMSEGNGITFKHPLRIAPNASGSKGAGLRGHHLAPSAQDAQIFRRIIAEQAGQPASDRPSVRFFILMLVRARAVVEGEHAFA